MPLGCLAALFGIKEKTTDSATSSEIPARSVPVPEHFPVATKRYFFSPDENQFFRSLEESLVGTPYRVFPNVRLGDILQITDKQQQNSVRGRMQNKHTDFLLVDASKDFQPVLAIELDGKSHQNEQQQHRDMVKDVLFRSANLPLLRVPSRKYTANEVRELVQPSLPRR